jgi:hypothetical protein
MKKENIPLVIGLCIPVLMVIGIAISIYLPTLFAPEPQYNFIYTSWNQSYVSHNYYVDNSTIVEEEAPLPYEGFKGTRSTPKLFLYDVKADKSLPISLEEAKKYKLDQSSLSPDGFEVSCGSYECDPFFMGCRNYGTVYLKGHHISKKLDIKKESNYCWNNFDFIGWIIE